MHREHDPLVLLALAGPAGKGWDAAIHAAGFALRRVAGARELQLAVHRLGGAVGGVLLDLRGIGDASVVQELMPAVSDPRVRCVCILEPQDFERPELFELALCHCIDGLVAPVDAAALRQALGSLQRRLRLLATARQQAPIRRLSSPGRGMIGVSAPMQRLFAEIDKVAVSDVPVFIAGETGVGKELAARAIHDLSPRREGPFIAINCGAIPQHLLQSELFGFERGAFTGAAQRKIGRLEMAQGGTVLLDEIGDLPLDSQVSLLRFLQEGRIERLGGTASIPVDVRIVSATHLDLDAAQRAGRFRSDLFHRLCVIQLDIPPLRERPEDIGLLAQHVVDTYRRDAPRPVRGLTADAMHALLAHHWPGNVRELVNRVRRALVMCEGGRIGAADLGLAELVQADAPLLRLDEIRDRAEGQAISRALVRNQHMVVRTADELGVSRATLYRLMERHGLGRDGRHTA